MNPTPGDKCAYAQAQVRKRAALLFDKIYASPYQLEEENIPFKLAFDVSNAHEHMKTVGDNWVKYFLKRSPKKEYIESEVASILTEFDVRLHVDSFRLSGYIVTPVYSSQQRFILDHPNGNSVVYQAAIENIPDIVEDDVSWDQIMEFRNDKDALHKYRELRLWLEHSISAESVEHARDIIAQKIDNYEWALKKYDLKTKTGAFSRILDWKGVLSITSGAGIGALAGGPFESLLAAGAFAVSRVSVWVAERMIERADIKRGVDSEVAIICDAKQFSKKGAST